jgi:hypothetical protein
MKEDADQQQYRSVGQQEEQNAHGSIPSKKVRGAIIGSG